MRGTPKKGNKRTTEAANAVRLATQLATQGELSGWQVRGNASGLTQCVTEFAFGKREFERLLTSAREDLRNFNTRSIVAHNKFVFDPNTGILKISPLHDMPPAWISFLQVKNTEWVVGNRPTQKSDDGRREPASTQLGRWTGTRRPHSRSETGLARGRFAFWTKIASMQIPLTESVMESGGFRSQKTTGDC
jgi:hypothetical protein